MNPDLIWDYFQTEGVDSFAGSLARLRFISRRFRPGTRVLNIGVGAGTFEKEALKRNIDVHSLDPSARALQLLGSDAVDNGRAKVGYCQQIPWSSGFFDGVVMSEVLEHLANDALGQTLREVDRVLRVGGLFCGTVPARERLRDQLVVCPCCGSRFHRWGHLQSFDRARIRSLLEQDYFVRTLSERNFVTWRTLNWKGRIGSAARIILRSVGVHGSRETIFFCATKRTAALTHTQRNEQR